MRKIRLLFALSLITGLLFTAVQPVQAATFNPTDPATLAQAITDANGTVAADIIDLAGNTITLTAALPQITSEITIQNGTLDGANSFQILNVTASGDLTVDNMTLQNGNATFGGGIYNLGTVTISNSTLSGNSATNGGGIYNRGTVTISNSTLSGNSATNGGGILNDGSTSVTISNSTLSGNSATFGGGILNDGSTSVTISNSTLSGNSATSNGGGIYNRGSSTVTLSNSSLSGNSATSGGGIYNLGTADISNSTLSGNSATRGGGIYNLGTADISNSTFSGNSATNSGGGIYNSNFGTVTLSNSTLSGNSATNSGGGIYNFPGGTVTLSNSIIANSLSGGDYNGTGPIATNGVNIVEDGTVAASANMLNVDPNLGALADNDGPTQTHALLVASPAIDASGAGATTTDQRGASANGTRDIGAFEFNGAVPTISFTVDEATLTEFGTITQTTVTITVANYSQPFNVSFTFTGTVDSADYTTSYSAPITINADGDTTFTIDIVNDAVVESPETLDLTLLLQGSADVLGSTAQTIQFINDEAPPLPVISDDNTAPASNNDEPNLANDPAAWDIQITADPAFVSNGQTITFTITVRKLIGGTPVQVDFPVPTGFSVSSAISNRGAVSLSGNNVTYLDDIHVGDVGIITVETLANDAQSTVVETCISVPVSKCTTLTLNMVQTLPATGETPWWRMMALLALGAIGMIGVVGLVRRQIQ